MTIRERIFEDGEIGEVLDEGIFAVIAEPHPDTLDLSDGHMLVVNIDSPDRIDLVLFSGLNKENELPIVPLDMPNFRCVINRCPNKQVLLKEQINNDSRVRDFLIWSES